MPNKALLILSDYKKLVNQKEYVLKYLENKNFQVDILDNQDIFFGQTEKKEIIDQLNQYKFGIILGGDGTVLYAGYRLIQSSIPLVSFNFGHLGFLTSVESDKIDDALNKLVQGDFGINQRNILEVEFKNKTDYVINDFVLLHKDPIKMLRVEVRIDNHLYALIQTDGIIISTATGSTGYNFATGGAIVWPDAKVMQFTTIAGNSLLPHPLIVSDKSYFTLEISPESKSEGLIIDDGIRTQDVLPKEKIKISLSDKVLNFADLFQEPFSTRLINKFKLNNQ